MTDTLRLPAATHIGLVTLQVASLERSLGFYRDLVGFHVLGPDGDAEPRRVRLGAEGTATPLVELREQRGARPVPPQGLLGLYHFALLLPDRPSLGRFVKHARERHEPMGAADHVFSEALYLTDPDGLQLEVYADRPRDTWTVRHGELVSGSFRLDLAGLTAAGGRESWTGVPTGSVVGHVHFYIGDLEAAEAFYHVALGMDKRIWSWPGALFVSAGGYHHHVGLNTWAAGAPQATEEDARLQSWTLVVPDRTVLQAVGERLSTAGYAVSAEGDAIEAVDPWGIVVRLVAQP